jgi:hypothetical protein
MELRCPTTVLAAHFNRYFRSVVPVDEASTLIISIGIAGGSAGFRIPDSLFIDKAVGNGSFALGGGVLKGSYDAQTRTADILVHRRLLVGRLIRVFEQFLYQVFYSDEGNKKADTFLIHASSVVRGDKGYVFTGPSGSGKSTISRLCAAERILNDEICLITIEGSQAWVSSTPFNGFFRKKVVHRAPLEGVFFLSHGKTHCATRVNAAKASTALLQQIVPPIGMGEEMGKESISRMFDLGEALLSRVAAYGLAFRRDRGFWTEIERVRREDMTGGGK